MNRHFKLIKQYPDSGCNLGDVIIFASTDDAIIFNTVENCEYFYSLKGCINFPLYWEEIYLKKSLCKTEDGVDVHEGDLIHWLIRDSENTLSYAYELPFVEEHLKFNFVDIYKIFSTKKAAEEYLKKNTILFTTEDGVNITKGDKYWFVISKKEVFSMIASEDGLSINVKRFSTKELADDYVNLNKKQYSLQDIMNAQFKHTIPVVGVIAIDLEILENGNK